MAMERKTKMEMKTKMKMEMEMETGRRIDCPLGSPYDRGEMRPLHRARRGRRTD